MTPTRALLDESAATALAETFKVLGDVTRVRILDAISASERCVHNIAAIVGLSESAVSHQLRLLRGMRLVRPRRAGRQVFYTLDDRHIVRLFEQGLEHVQERDRPPAAVPGRSLEGGGEGAGLRSRRTWTPPAPPAVSRRNASQERQPEARPSSPAIKPPAIKKAPSRGARS